VANDGFICLNADVLCHPGIIAPAAQIRTDISMIIDPAWRDETMKVIIKARRIIRMSKTITRSEFSGTYLGVTTFSDRVVKLLFEEIEKLILQGHVNEFFNVAVQQMISYGIQVDHTLTFGLPWAEIDDPADFRFAEACVYPLLPASTAMPAQGPAFNTPNHVAA
jgi:choline kinase